MFKDKKLGRSGTLQTYVFSHLGVLLLNMAKVSETAIILLSQTFSLQVFFVSFVFPVLLFHPDICLAQIS